MPVKFRGQHLRIYSISNSCIPQQNHRPSRRSLIEDSRDSSESAKSVVSSEILVTGIFYVVHNFAKSKKDRYEKENHYRIGCADINGQLSRCAGHL